MDTQQPPTTVKEVGIHIFYLNKNMEELTEKFEQATHVFVTKQEFEPVAQNVKRLETAVQTLMTTATVTRVTEDTRTSRRRNILEVAGTIGALLTAYATYLLGRGH